jgi:hypothetical protein
MTGPSDYFLDRFVAPKLSLLTGCGAPELSAGGPWLNGFILRAFLVGLSSDKRAYLFNFVRKTESAVFAYKEARSALLEYVATPRNVISPYFRSLSNFETCFAQCFQGFELLMTGSKEPLFKEDDGSELDRLRVIHNTSKHLDERIEKGEIPAESTAPIWITNQGIEALGKGAVPTSLSFAELAALLNQMSGLADKLSTLEPPAGVEKFP